MTAILQSAGLQMFGRFCLFCVALGLYVLVGMLAGCTQANARPSSSPVTHFCGDRVCAGEVQVFARKSKRASRKIVRHREPVMAAYPIVQDGPRYPIHEAPMGRRINTAPVASYDVAVIGGRPSGCPHRYCGCGLRKYLGIEDVRLNLARNWARIFQRTSPRVGAAVVWRSHVALIVGGSHGAWVLRDYNSGGGLSRIHTRSIAGAVFVDPTIRVAMR